MGKVIWAATEQQQLSSDNTRPVLLYVNSICNFGLGSIKNKILTWY